MSAVQPDAIIVGAGAAGLAAALRASSLGLRVLVLDPGGGLHSNLARSGGMFTAAGTRFQAQAGIADEAEAWEADLRRHVGAALEDAVVQAVTRQAASAAHFLADFAGLDLHVVTGVTVADGVPRLHATSGESGQELADQLLAAVRTCPGVTLLPTEAQGLLVEGAAVVGVQTIAGPVRASATLLASGGFGADRAMIKQHAPEIADAAYIGNAASDGRAIRWAQQLGAATRFMASYQGQGHVAADGKGRLGPGLGSFGAIVVNARGERFADETMSPSSFAAHVLAQPGGCAIELFDAAADQAARRFGPYRDYAASGGVKQAGDIAAAAALFGVPEQALRLALQEAGGQDADRFGRTRHRRELTPPFWGTVITGALAHTQGGLHVDGRSRVLREDGTPIPGLLAAGGAAASISGTGAAGYIPGNGLAHAFTLGMLAAETVARGRGAGV